MTHVDTVLPFFRRVTLDSGRTLRIVEDRPVSLRTLEATALSKPARMGDGTPLLEFEGRRVFYASLQERYATLDALRERMEREARREVGYKALNRGRGRRVPQSGVADDGLAAVEAAIARMERSTVFVEGWVARLVGPEIIETLVTVDGRIGLVDHYGAPTLKGEVLAMPRGGDLPWMGFHIDRRPEAETFARALGEALRELDLAMFAQAGYARMDGALTWSVEDTDAVRRMAAPSEAYLPTWSAEAMLEMVRDTVIHLGRGTVEAYLDLRDAHADGDDRGMVLAMRALGRGIAASARPEGVEDEPWLALRVAGLSAAIRFEGLDPAPGAKRPAGREPARPCNRYLDRPEPRKVVRDEGGPGDWDGMMALEEMPHDAGL